MYYVLEGAYYFNLWAINIIFGKLYNTDKSKTVNYVEAWAEKVFYR